MRKDAGCVHGRRGRYDDAPDRRCLRRRAEHPLGSVDVYSNGALRILLARRNEVERCQMHYYISLGLGDRMGHRRAVPDVNLEDRNLSGETVLKVFNPAQREIVDDRHMMIRAREREAHV